MSRCLLLRLQSVIHFVQSHFDPIHSVLKAPMQLSDVLVNVSPNLFAGVAAFQQYFCHIQFFYECRQSTFRHQDCFYHSIGVKTEMIRSRKSSANTRQSNCGNVYINHRSFIDVGDVLIKSSRELVRTANNLKHGVISV